MGGDYTQDGNMEHRPYTSVRKLFYNFPSKSELDNSNSNNNERLGNEPRKHSKEGRFSKIFQKSVYDDNITYVGKRNGEMKNNRRISLNLKFISRFSESYSDLYFEPSPTPRRQSDSKLLKSSWMTRSENKLNLPEFFYSNFPAKRVKSFFDTSKLQQRASVFYPSNGWDEESEYSIYDDTESDQKSPVDDYWSYEEDTDNENSLKKFNSIESPQPIHRCSSSSLASHWSSFSDSHNGYLVPWTKRQQKSKKNRPKSKPKLTDYRISSSFDQIRTARYDYEDHERISVTDDKVELLPRFDNEKNSVMTNLLHSRRSLSRSSYHVIACCDGVFGCD